jgi:invasion protein IalB
VRCKDGVNPNEIKNKRGVCEIFQRQDIGETGERILEFAITYPEGQKDAFGILILPTGILLQEGVKLSVDDGDMYQLSVRYCIPNGCIVHFNLDEKLINLMAKGKAASVNIFSANGQNLAISVPLTGFAKMLKGVQS